MKRKPANVKQKASNVKRKAPPIEQKAPPVIQMREAITDWAKDFRLATNRTSFVLALSQPMIEFLCAVADNVGWDRRDYCTVHRPDNWIASENALTKRGLIRRKTEAEKIDNEKWEKISDCCYCALTPAGEALVELFKVTGIFVEADAAMRKRSKA